jgi:hypothetical protein
MNTPDVEDSYRTAQRRVRARLKFYRDVATYAVVISALFLIDWLTGNDWWVQWVAGVWGGFLVLDAFNTFVLRNLWGKDAEERMIQEELRRKKAA